MDRKEFSYGGPDLMAQHRSGLAEARGQFGTQKLSRNGLLLLKIPNERTFFLGTERTTWGQKRTAYGAKRDSSWGKRGTGEEENLCSSSYHIRVTFVCLPVVLFHTCTVLSALALRQC